MTQPSQIQVFQGPNFHCKGKAVAVVFPLLSALESDQLTTLQAELTELLPRLLPDPLASLPFGLTISNGHHLGLIAALLTREVLNLTGACIVNFGAAAFGPEKIIIFVGYHPGNPKQSVTALQEITNRLYKLASLSPASQGRLDFLKDLQLYCRTIIATAPDNYPGGFIAKTLRQAEITGIGWLKGPADGHHYQLGAGSNSTQLHSVKHDKESIYLSQRSKSYSLYSKELQQLHISVQERFTIHQPAQTWQSAKTSAPKIRITHTEYRSSPSLSLVLSNLSISEQRCEKLIQDRREASRSLLLDSFDPNYRCLVLLLNGDIASIIWERRHELQGDGKTTVADLIKLHSNLKLNSKALAALYQLGVHSKDVLNTGESLQYWLPIQSGTPPSKLPQRLERASLEAAKQLQLARLELCWELSDEKSPAVLHAISSTPDLARYHQRNPSGITAGLLSNCNRISTVLIVADNPTTKKVLEKITDLYRDNRLNSWQLGLGIYSDEQLLFEGVELNRLTSQNNSGNRQKQGVEQLLRNRNCRRLLIFTDAMSALRHGLPADYFDLVVGCHKGFIPQNIFNMVMRVSQRVLHTETATTLLSNNCWPDVATALSSEPEPLTGICQVGQRLELKLNWHDPNQIRERTGPTVLALIKNEMSLLPHFLEHYRGMGITKFCFYDDNSDDGSREYLVEQRDCAIIDSAFQFSQTLEGGVLFHHALKRQFTESLAPGQWSIIVDLDEFLFIPNHYHQQLDRFLKDLECDGIAQVTAPMVDFYPETLGQLSATQNSPFVSCPLFDPEIGYYRDEQTGRFLKSYGGIRPRLIQQLYRQYPDRYEHVLGSGSYDMPATWKTPLIQSGRGLHLVNSHNTNGVAPFNVQCALAHFKLNHDLGEKIERAIQLQQHFLGSIEYKLLAEFMSLLPDSSLRNKKSVFFKDASSFEQCGFIYYERSSRSK